jgi:hypothetical protein
MVKNKLLSLKLGPILVGYFVFLHLGCFMAFGADWYFFGESEEFNFYYDTESAKYPSKGIIRIWVKSVVKENIHESGKDQSSRESGSIVFDDKKLIEKMREIVDAASPKVVKQLIEISCKDQQYRVITETKYNKKGEVINSVTIADKQLEWEYIIPETLIEGLYKIICPKNK